MNKNHDCHREFFHHHQLKNTPARDRVYHLLQAHQPLTLEALFSIIQSQHKDKRISHSTVFRILEQFIKAQIVEKISLDIAPTPFYQLRDDHHHHQLVCVKCKQIVSIEECPLTEFEKKMAKKHHFQIEQHQFTLYGVCQSCQKI